MEGARDEASRGAPELAIVVPAFNDADVLDGTLEAIGAYLEARGVDAEVVVVDDGSTDGTAALVQRKARERPWLRLLRQGRNRGKGAAVRAGVLESTGAVVLFSDADLSTPIEELDLLLAALDAGHDVAMGSRALAESRVTLRQSPLREGAGKTFNVLVRHLVLPGFLDTQCGFKCFRREAADEIFGRQQATGFEFDVELLCLARQLGYSVAEVPVTWRNRPRSHVRFFRDSASMLLGLLRLRGRFTAEAPSLGESLRGAWPGRKSG